MSKRGTTGQRIRRYFGVALVITAAVATMAQQPERPRYFDIPAQSLASALLEFSRQADMQLLVDAQLTEGLRSAEVAGRYTPTDALHRLIRGQPLEVRLIGERTVAIAPTGSRAPRPAPGDDSMLGSS